MTGYILIKNPIDRNVRLSQPDESYVLEPKLKADYLLLVGALNWLACMTRPNISYTVSRLSKYLTRLTKDYIYAARRVLRYLAAIAITGLIWGLNILLDGALIGYSDSFWNNDINNRKSIIGYLFKL